MLGRRVSIEPAAAKESPRILAFVSLVSFVLNSTLDTSTATRPLVLRSIGQTGPFLDQRPTTNLRLVALIVGAQVQPGAGEVNRVLADLVAKHAAGLAVLVAGDVETAGNISQP